MSTKHYEISDYQQNQIMHLFPVTKTGRPPKDNRMVLNAILMGCTERFRMAWSNHHLCMFFKSDYFPILDTSMY